MATHKELVVLMVDDDCGDIELTREGLRDAKVIVTLLAVQDGVEAMMFLRHEPPYEDAPRPDVIFLDLNMPRKNGIETLREIKGDPAFKAIPVVVLTSSDAEPDVRGSYMEGANCYVRKPVGLESFTKVVREIENFWFSIVKLPG